MTYIEHWFEDNYLGPLSLLFKANISHSSSAQFRPLFIMFWGNSSLLLSLLLKCIDQKIKNKKNKVCSSGIHPVQVWKMSKGSLKGDFFQHKIQPPDTGMDLACVMTLLRVPAWKPHFKVLAATQRLWLLTLLSGQPHPPPAQNWSCNSRLNTFSTKTKPLPWLLRCCLSPKFLL